MHPGAGSGTASHPTTARQLGIISTIFSRISKLHATPREEIISEGLLSSCPRRHYDFVTSSRVRPRHFGRIPHECRMMCSTYEVVPNVECVSTNILLIGACNLFPSLFLFCFVFCFSPSAIRHVQS